MTGNRWSSIVAMVILATLLVTLGVAHGEKKKLVWTTCCGQPDRTILFDKLAAEYEEMHPDVDIERIHPTGGGYYDILLTWIAGGKGADVMWLGNGFTSFVDELMPLERIEQEVPAIHPGMLKVYEFGGRQLGLPFGTNTHTMAYNKGLYDQAGVTYPTSAWTWDDLVDKARRLTKDRDGDGSPDQWGLDINYTQAAFNYGPGFFVDGGRKADFANPVATKAVQLFADINSGKLGINPVDLDGAPREHLLDQQAAMANAGVYALPNIRENATFDWDIVTFPWLDVDGKKYRTTYMSGEAWTIYRGTKYPDVAQDFVKFLLTEAGPEVAEAGIIVPTQRAFVSEYLQIPPPPQNLMATVDSMDFGEKLFTVHPAGNDLRAVIQKSDQWAKLWNGELPATSVLPEWEKAANQVLKEYWDRRDAR